MTEVVVLGGGFAGVSTVQELERRAPAHVNVTLVNRENFFLFTPMLPEVASGSIDMRAIAQPLRASLRRTHFVLGEAHTIDVRARTVTVRHPVLQTESTIRYDHLVLALGSETSTLGVAGVEEHAYPLKTLPDAGRLRARIGGAFEAAAASNDRVERDRLLRFVIVGGGFTGVEAAGELDGYVRRLHRYYPLLNDLTPEVVIIEHEHRLLVELPSAFGKYAAASLRRREVRLELGEEVASVDAAGLTLKSGKRHESGTVIWTAGVEPAPIVKKLGLETSKHGALIVNADLSVPGIPGLWSAGDCARVPKPDGGEYAPLAQNAVHEGPLLARNVLAAIEGKPTTRFHYRRLGMMASLGHHDGIAQLPGNRKVTGLPAWLLWRAYYLTRLPGIPRKLHVAADWTLSGLFAPNIARLPWISASLTAKVDHAPEG
jgi:NADH:ubiquinone reductase (H+-translocating)